MTLSDAAGKTKLILKWVSIGFGVLISVFLIISLFSFLRNTFFPAPPPPPEVSFGKLPPPDFPESLKGEYSFTVDTISGNLPAFSTLAKVYKMEEREPDILGLSKAKSLVSNVGFTTQPAKISESIYQWKDEAARTLTLNITDLNFNMISDFLGNPNQPLFSKDKETAKQTAQDFLQNIGLMPSDLDFEKTSADLYQIKNYSIIPATSLSSAQAIQVSFFQRNFNNLPIFYSRFSVSTINFLIGDVRGNTEVVEANFFYQQPSEISSTYPIKSVQKAFDDLKKGNAYVIKKGTEEKIGIKNITLGYYISERKHDYLLPIIVFESADGFVAFVSAITDEWVNK